jgi:HEAT repeat protein
MSSFPDSQQNLSPDDSLPPVEPPSAGFILQLFIVPGVIVVVVVMVWLLFNWLAQKGNDRDAFVRDLGRNNAARWQAAFNLANELRSERNSRDPKLTIDSRLAKQLADILNREIDAGSMDDNSIELRVYLCRALGEFKVTDGLPTLIKAATTQRDDREADVRRAALEGIAILAANFAPADKQFAAFTENSALQEALLKAAGDSDPRTRSAAAVAMGVIGTQQYLEKLRGMLDDAYPDVRYNAATRLAHHGDAAAVPELVEMLDPDEMAGVEAEKEASMRPQKRAVIVINALRASAQLAENNASADLVPLKTAIEKLLASKPASEVRVEATAVLRQLDQQAAKTTR